MRTDLSYYKIIYRKFVDNRNEENTDTYEKACLFRSIIIRNQ